MVNVRWRVWLWSYAPLFVWVGVIFYLSSDSGSMSNTSRFLRPILVFLFPSADEPTLLFYHGIVRKLAHLTEYAVLGVLAARAFCLAEFRHWAVISLIFSTTIAMIDEINQSFSNSRTGSPYDVLIDCVGAAFGVGVACVINHRYSRRGPSE